MEISAIRFNAVAIGALAAIAALAGCGGGGGGNGGGTIPNAGGPTPAPTATSSAPATQTSSSPSPGPQIAGAISINNTAVNQGKVVYTCGCSAQAGIAQTDQNGNYVLPISGPAIPATPSPTYTMVPGRNYLVVAKSQAGAEAWTMAFLGNIPAHNLTLGSSMSQSADIYSAAAALYVFFTSPPNGPQADLAFNQWNFNTIEAWAQHLRSTSLSSLTQPERQLLTDIMNAQTANQTLFPGAPAWYPGPTPQSNTTIKADLTTLHASASGDTAIPTPCPGGEGSCTGTPIP